MINSDINHETPWFCIKTKPKNEALARKALKMIPGVEVYCPMVRFKRPTKRGPVWFKEALFPGYLFARFNPHDLSRWVLSAFGVSAIVQFGSSPYASITKQVIADLQEAIPEGREWVYQELYKEGSEVLVLDGPFMGIRALITHLLPARDRVRILMDFMGRPTETEVSMTSLSRENARRVLMAV